MATILLVDDDPDMREVIADLLRDEGHTVRMAQDGEEGLRLLAQARPDLILCDVEMPVLDGPSMVYRILLRDAGDEEIPVILASGVADLDRVAGRLGTPYFLGKPFMVAELLGVLNRALSERMPPKPEPDAQATAP